MSDASRPARGDTAPGLPRPSNPASPTHPVPGTANASGGGLLRNFIQEIVDQESADQTWGLWRDDEARPGNDLAPGVRAGTPRVHTRFPPEPNGYLHLGHAKSICLNFGLARAYGGKFNLRFDDTNPAKEEQEYVEAIKRDVLWLGADFTGPNGGGIFWGSDYFQQMYDWAEELVSKGLAYVCQLSAEEVARRRGSPSVPATSPFRDRPAEESLRLLRQMRDGLHPDGSMTLRAKIDLASPNFNLRDPVMYRILHEPHHNTGTRWCIYPMYDWAHGFEDALEGITHSICTLEFENHRPLYDWFIDAVNKDRRPDGSGPWGRPIHHPRQIEFAKFRPTYTVLSKRNLLKMVEGRVVSGWDDPRMPTIAGLRRRGYPPQAIRDVCEEVGVTKVEGLVDLTKIENAVRNVLNRTAPRALAVLRPLKVTIDNWPSDQTDHLDFVINPEDPAAGRRKVPFAKTIYIERDDFIEHAPKKFFRLTAPPADGTPGPEVRLRWAYFLRCTGLIKDDQGHVTELRATIDPATRGGDAPPGPDGQPPRKVKGTIHWVSAEHAVPVTVRLYDRLFTAEEPGQRTGNFLDDLNPRSLETLTAMAEPALAHAGVGDVYQFERLGYFRVDEDSRPGQLIFNRTVTLKDSWAKEASKD